jgi:hypothetical protein
VPPSPGLAHLLDHADQTVRAFQQGRTEGTDQDALAAAVDAYADAVNITRTKGRYLPHDALALASGLLTNLALWQDVHADGGPSMLQHLKRAGIRRSPRTDNSPAARLALELVLSPQFQAALPTALVNALGNHDRQWLDVRLPPGPDRPVGPLSADAHVVHPAHPRR